MRTLFSAALIGLAALFHGTEAKAGEGCGSPCYPPSYQSPCYSAPCYTPSYCPPAVTYVPPVYDYVQVPYYKSVPYYDYCGNLAGYRQVRCYRTQKVLVSPGYYSSPGYPSPGYGY